MSAFTGTIYSKTLRMMTSLSVCLPGAGKHAAAAGEMPVLYLLHGLSDNHSAWLRRSNVDRYAESAGLAVVMPEVQRGFYSDMAYGVPYFTYLTDELPRLCNAMFRLSQKREETFVAGLSMGGYGALKAALRCPERYGAAASFSGAVDLQQRLLDADSPMLPGEAFAISGGPSVRDEDDLVRMVERTEPDSCPRLYITCGREDYMVEDNRAFSDGLTRRGISHRYEEWAGGHEWDFWDESIRRAVRFFVGDVRAEAG